MPCRTAKGTTVHHCRRTHHCAHQRDPAEGGRWRTEQPCFRLPLHAVGLHAAPCWLLVRRDSSIAWAHGRRILRHSLREPEREEFAACQRELDAHRLRSSVARQRIALHSDRHTLHGATPALRCPLCTGSHVEGRMSRARRMPCGQPTHSGRPWQPCGCATGPSGEGQKQAQTCACARACVWLDTDAPVTEPAPSFC